MAFQISDPEIIAKIERLAKSTGRTTEAAIEYAVDRMWNETHEVSRATKQMHALLKQLDQIPDRKDAINPLEWDEFGLPI